jgi:hypothetical protein
MRSAALLLHAAAALDVRSRRNAFEVVVCRWNEDVSWLAASGAPYVLYNKGDAIDDPNIVQLDSNVGKENFCYLKHIIDNYDSQTHRGTGIAGLTLFSQADPFDHAVDYFLDQVKLLHNNTENAQYQIGNSSGFVSLGKQHFSITDDGCPVFCDEGNPWVARVYREIFLRAPDPHFFPLTFSPGAIFAVTREAILSRPKHFYENILSLIDKERDPLTGHGLERLWSAVFNKTLHPELMQLRNSDNALVARYLHQNKRRGGASSEGGVGVQPEAHCVGAGEGAEGTCAGSIDGGIIPRRLRVLVTVAAFMDITAAQTAKNYRLLWVQLVQGLSTMCDDFDLHVAVHTTADLTPMFRSLGMKGSGDASAGSRWCFSYEVMQYQYQYPNPNATDTSSDTNQQTVPLPTAIAFGLTYEHEYYMLDRRYEYDVFAYWEDDMLFNKHHLDAWLREWMHLRGTNYLPGFARFELSTLTRKGQQEVDGGVEADDGNAAEEVWVGFGPNGQWPAQMTIRGRRYFHQHNQVMYSGGFVCSQRHLHEYLTTTTGEYRWAGLWPRAMPQDAEGVGASGEAGAALQLHWEGCCLDARECAAEGITCSGKLGRRSKFVKVVPVIDLPQFAVHHMSDASVLPEHRAGKPPFFGFFPIGFGPLGPRRMEEEAATALGDEEAQHTTGAAVASAEDTGAVAGGKFEHVHAVGGWMSVVQSQSWREHYAGWPHGSAALFNRTWDDGNSAGGAISDARRFMLQQSLPPLAYPKLHTMVARGALERLAGVGDSEGLPFRWDGGAKTDGQLGDKLLTVHLPTKGPLLLRLGLHPFLLAVFVRGFQRKKSPPGADAYTDEADAMGAAEASGKIAVGDYLVGINQYSLEPQHCTAPYVHVSSWGSPQPHAALGAAGEGMSCPMLPRGMAMKQVVELMKTATW